MRGILRINDTTESSFEHSIDEACKATNPHEAIREYARRKMKGTKYDSGYYRRDPVSIQFKFPNSLKIFISFVIFTFFGVLVTRKSIARL